MEYFHSLKKKKNVICTFDDTSKTIAFTATHIRAPEIMQIQEY